MSDLQIIRIKAKERNKLNVRAATLFSLPVFDPIDDYMTRKGIPQSEPHSVDSVSKKFQPCLTISFVSWISLRCNV